MDLGFLIDASGSIGAENFDKIKDFVKRIVDAFDVGPEGTHVGAIWYSDKAEVAFAFNNFTGPEVTKANIFKAVDTIQVTTGKTRIDQALRLAYNDLYSEKGGVRFDKPKVWLMSYFSGPMKMAQRVFDMNTMKLYPFGLCPSSSILQKKCPNLIFIQYETSFSTLMISVGHIANFILRVHI